MDNNRPTNDRLISFAISMMLTSAFLSTAPEGIISASAGPAAPGQAITNALNGLQASGWHGASELAIPVPVNMPLSATTGKKETPLPAPITEAQLRKVLIDLSRTGAEVAINPLYATHLGLSKDGNYVQIRQLALEDDNAIQYGFALLKDGSGYYLDKGPRGGNRVAFHLDENMRIVTAIAINSAKEVTPLPLPDAESKLREVLATWAEYADTL